MRNTLDQALVLALAERGCVITERQARRWREDGQLPATTSTSHGREGFTFAYPDEVIDQAECLAELMGSYRNADLAAIVLFLRGFAPRERALRGAYQRLYDGMLEELGQPPSGQAEPVDKRMSQHARRSSTDPRLEMMRQRLRQNEYTTPLAAALANIAAVCLGSKDETLRPGSLVALGFGDPPPPLADRLVLSKLARALNLRHLQATAMRAPLDALKAGRETIERLNEVVKAAGNASRITGVHPVFDAAEQWLSSEPVRALAIPGLAALQRTRLLGRLFEEGLAELEAALPRFHALASLADALPMEWHRYQAPDGMAALALETDETQNKVFSVVRQWAQDHPDEAALLHQPDST